MVTLQILVLPFLVRVRVAQRRRARALLFFILFLFRPFSIDSLYLAQSPTEEGGACERVCVVCGYS